MASISLTDQQRRAVRTTGRSVIVSAAAGSGKTAVLAERCAYLVCDAPSEVRCNVDELLVLTFTEAAAAEMRSRIVEAIRARLEARPADARLRDQVALVDAAQISTVHAFCLWLIRRWFSDLGIDPTATVLDADETRLLKNEVLDALFTDLYDATRPPGEPLGTVEGSPTPEGERGSTETRPLGSGHQSSGATSASKKVLGQAFVKLVNDYGLGEDRDLVRFVLKLFDFTMSLPDPERWLREAHESLAFHPERLVVAMVQELQRELNWQAEHCEQMAAMLEASDSAGHFYAAQIRTYVDQLFTWAAMLNGSRGGSEPRVLARADESRRAGMDDLLTRFEAVRQQIADFQFSRATGPRLSKDADSAVKAARDAASAQLSEVKKRLFSERLKKRFGLFSVQECIEGLKRTAPYVATLVDLANAFRDAYTAKKREMNVLDFADLERLAFDLLRSEEAPEKPSEAACTLHRRFAHVLVDEFQDINPIQQAIIRLVSRECDPDRPGNLFVVGDVKQSIYRFRLAEPEVFAKRLHGFRDGTEDGVAIALQSNFRSRPEILEAVNLVFRQLMREGAGNIVYDAEAELHPGRKIESNLSPQPVEVHLLERSWEGSHHDDETLERGIADFHDPALWAPIEREAFLIGSRIRSWMVSGGLALDDRPLRYRDIAVLLRARRINAERMASMMTSMGIPAYADVGGSLFGAREVRDVLAALQLFDNFQQDIPLAAVLRSGILGEPLSADELVKIRCLDRAAPFQEAVREYARRGEDVGLRERLVALIDRVNRYRAAVRRRPLADVLWDLYEQQGYLAYACGLPNGPQRRANLLKLHELARQFGSFRRQGLHRFLRFVRSLEEENQEMAVAPAISEADDVVRIMSIHQAKGLEFPVVFVAGLGTKFNLGDRSGRMIFERTAKIGLRAVDTDRMIEYPTVAHRQAASEIERATRDEELRVLYVAMTRARDKLVLVGSQRNVERYTYRGSPASENPPPSRFVVATAATPLDWLMPALAGAPTSCRTATRLFEVHLHTVNEMAGWRAADRKDEHDHATKQAVARCEALPAHEPLAPDDPAVEQVLSQLEYVYPSLSSASIRATMAASEFRGAYDYTRNPEQRPDQSLEDDFQFPPSKYATAKPDEAARRGVVTHRILQHLDFAVAVDASGVASELQRMVTAGWVTRDDLAAVDRCSIEWFVSTPLAEAIRRAGGAYRREFMYIATESLNYFDAGVDSPSDDSVLVRGIVDGILPVAEGIEIVDFKTDVIRPAEVAERCERYRPQMELYALAMSRIWRQPVRACWLVFLAARKLVKWKPSGERRQHSVISFQPDR